MRHMLALGATALLIATPAQAQTAALPDGANVKAGVDAWGQGDYGRAVAIWRPLADAGDGDAQFNMGQAYKLGNGVPADSAVALEWYRKAAAQGHARAEDNYGLLLFQLGKRQDAMPYLKKAAERGEPRAQYLYGTALFNGEYVAKDWVRAYAMMVRSDAQGVGAASSSLSQMNMHVPEDQRQQGIALAVRLVDEEKAARAIAAKAPSPIGSKPTIITLQGPAARTTRKPEAAPQPEQKPAATKPTPPPKAATPEPKATAPKSGPWRVQLGAFSAEANANGLWKRLSGKGALAGYQHYVVKGDGVVRLLAGPLASQADAEALCRAVKAGGNDCLIKKP